MIFSVILIGHWFGDYLFQFSSMAVKKSYSLKWLGLHVLTYTAVLLLFCLCLFSVKLALVYVLTNAILHAVTDFFTSKLAYAYKDQPRIFYPILGFDQLIHTLTLYLTYLHLETIESLFFGG